MELGSSFPAVITETASSFTTHTIISFYVPVLVSLGVIEFLLPPYKLRKVILSSSVGKRHLVTDCSPKEVQPQKLTPATLESLSTLLDSWTLLTAGCLGELCPARNVASLETDNWGELQWKATKYCQNCCYFFKKKKKTNKNQQSLGYKVSNVNKWVPGRVIDTLK